MSWATRCSEALDPKAAAIHARAGGALDAADAWLVARQGESEKTEKQLRSAARRAAGQNTFSGHWSGWSDQDQDDPIELLAAREAAAAIAAAALAASDLAADWESMDTQLHASACRITRRRAQQLRALHLKKLAVQGVLL